MPDKFDDLTPGLTSPLTDGVTVTPDDNANIAQTSRAIFIGGAGDIRVTLASGSVITFAGAQAGLLPIRVSRVHATGTNASNIVALW